MFPHVSIESWNVNSKILWSQCSIHIHICHLSSINVSTHTHPKILRSQLQTFPNRWATLMKLSLHLLQGLHKNQVIWMFHVYSKSRQITLSTKCCTVLALAQWWSLVPLDLQEEHDRRINWTLLVHFKPSSQDSGSGGVRVSAPPALITCENSLWVHKLCLHSPLVAT